MLMLFKLDNCVPPSTGGETVSAPDNIQTWQMVKGPIYDKEARKVTAPGELQRVETPVPELSPGEVLVKIAGCGVCHTDMAYFYDGVPTMTKPPLTLGHEIAGTVVAAGPGAESWIGKNVIVPAVMPCNNCVLAPRKGTTAVSHRKCPGIHWGFMEAFPATSQSLRVIFA